MDRITGMGIDDRGNPYVVGQTSSADFPTTPDADFPTIAGGDDAFVAKIHSSGTRLLYSSFFGSDLRDEAIAVAVDDPGNAYVAGFTSAPNFPTTSGAANRTHSGKRDGFLLKLPLVNPPISGAPDGVESADDLVSNLSVGPAADQMSFTIRVSHPAAIVAQLFNSRGLAVGGLLVDANYDAGTHPVSIPLGGISSGGYLLRVRSQSGGRPAQQSIQHVVVVR